jgi:hypothetical protein
MNQHATLLEKGDRRAPDLRQAVVFCNTTLR